MIPKQYTTPEGHRLFVCKQNKFKSESLSLSAALPIRGQKPWMTTLLLSVLRRGCDRYPTLAKLNERLDYLWGTELSVRNFYRGDSHIVGFHADFLGREYLPSGEDPIADVLEVMTQLIFHPLLDEKGLLQEKYVESEKKLHCDGLRSLQNNPRSYAAVHCGKEVYRGEPCGISSMGEIEEIMAVTPSMLTDHWRSLMASYTPDFFYIGQEDPHGVIRRIEAVYGRETGGSSVTPPALVLVPPVFKEQTVRLDEELPVSQGQLILALRTPVNLLHPLYPALLLYNEILGGSPVSKLFMNVRERMGLCYHCSSSFNSYKGTVSISCGLEPSNRETAERAIRAQIDAMAQGDFDAGEQMDAVRSLSHAYRQFSDSPGALEGYYYGRALLGINTSHVEAGESFSRVTREEIIQVAQTMRLDTVYFLKGTLTGGEWNEED